MFGHWPEDQMHSFNALTNQETFGAMLNIPRYTSIFDCKINFHALVIHLKLSEIFQEGDSYFKNSIKGFMFLAGFRRSEFYDTNRDRFTLLSDRCPAVELIDSLVLDGNIYVKAMNGV